MSLIMLSLIHLLLCCICLSDEEKYSGQSVTQEGEVALIWETTPGSVCGRVFLNQLHRLTFNPCQFSHILHLHYPLTLPPAPQEKNIISPP